MKKTKQITLLKYINERLIVAILEKEYQEGNFDSIEPVDATVNGIEYNAYWLYNREPETTFHMDMEEYIAYEVKRKNDKNDNSDV